MTSPTDPIEKRIAEIKERCEKATFPTERQIRNALAGFNNYLSGNDLYVYASVPWLISELEQTRAELKELRWRMDGLEK